MATVQLNAQDFEKTITDNNLVFVDFWATWCGPCRAFGPTFEAASEENPDIVFGKVDIDANQDLASAAGIQAVPTLMIAKQGQIIFKQAGALRAEDLDDLIAQAKALDVSAAAQDSGGRLHRFRKLHLSAPPFAKNDSDLIISYFYAAVQAF